MATFETIQICKDNIKQRGIRNLDGTLSNVDLDFFGIKHCVDEQEFMELSISEKSRHKRENQMLLMVYADN